MPPANELSLSGVSSDAAVFWSRGNAPTQKTERLDLKVLRLHFVAAYLLSDKLVASASFFFESSDTRKVTREFAEVFRRGDAIYFVDESMDGFHHHGRRKREKSPTSLHCYHDGQLIESVSNELESLDYILRRPDKSVSEGIAKLWSADVISSQKGTLGFQLARVIKEKERLFSIVAKLQAICTDRGERDFVWEFIAPVLVESHLPQNFQLFAKRRLAQFYSIATGALLGMPIDAALRVNGRFLGPQSCFDTTLFLECMDAMSLVHALSALDANAVLRLKRSSEFLIFRDFYFCLVDAAAYSPKQLAKVLPLYARAEKQERLFSADRDSVIFAFSNWCKQLKGNPSKYEIALDKLLSAYDAFGSHVIRDLSKYVSLLANPQLANSAVQTDSSLAFVTPAQGVIGSTAGRDIVQIHIHQSMRQSEREKGMSISSNESKELARTTSDTSSQIVTDVRTMGKITQSSEHSDDNQEIRRAVVVGDISQRKTALPEMSFAWGKARGYGVVGLLLAFFGWLAYKFLVAQ